MKSPIVWIFILCMNSIVIPMELQENYSMDMKKCDPSCFGTYFLPLLDLQTIGRFARVCKTFEIYSFDKIFNKISPESLCFSDLCHDYDRCSRGLVHCAQKNNTLAFGYLWRFHGEQRREEIIQFLELDTAELNQKHCMAIYRKKYHRLEKNKKEWAEKEKKQRLKTQIQQISDGFDAAHREINCIIWKLKDGECNLLELHDRGFRDISAFFPGKKDSKLLYYVCKNARSSRDLFLMARAYMAQFPSKTMDYLFQLNKLGVLYDLVAYQYLDINTQSTSGKTILHYLNYKCGCHNDFFCSFRCDDDQYRISHLLALGPDINRADNKGMTVLHYACKHLHVNAIKMLLEVKGIDIHKKNNKNKTPLDYVRYLSSYAKKPDNDIVKDRKIVTALLQSHGNNQKDV